MRLHDGAYGTLLQGHLHGDETTDDLCVRAPALVEHAHTAYLDAGCDTLQTNAFLAFLRDPRSRRRRELQLAAIECARAAAAASGRDDVLVVATLGPAGDEPAAFWHDLEWLLGAGVRAVRCETVTTLAVADAFLAAWAEVAAGVTDVSVLLGASVDEDAPHWLAELAARAPEEVQLGLNCCRGPIGLRPSLELLVEHRGPGRVWADPSAGLPPHLAPADWAEATAELVHGLDLAGVGGCCGTTPDALAALCESVAT